MMDVLNWIGNNPCLCIVLLIITLAFLESMWLGWCKAYSIANKDKKETTE